MKHYLYILRSRVKETYYSGVSHDPVRRHFFHNNGSKGYTRRFRPWDMVYAKAFGSRELALLAEQKVKRWKSRKMIRLLVEGKIDLNDYV